MKQRIKVFNRKHKMYANSIILYTKEIPNNISTISHSVGEYKIAQLGGVKEDNMEFIRSYLEEVINE